MKKATVEQTQIHLLSDELVYNWKRALHMITQSSPECDISDDDGTVQLNAAVNITALAAILRSVRPTDPQMAWRLHKDQVIRLEKVEFMLWHVSGKRRRRSFSRQALLDTLLSALTSTSQSGQASLVSWETDRKSEVDRYIASHGGTDADIYREACVDRSDFYRWVRGEIAETSRMAYRIRQVLSS